jgi:hypothetical protein
MERMNRAVTPSIMHIGRPKLLTPLANSFMRHRDSTFSEEFFDFMEAETGSMIEPMAWLMIPEGKRWHW